MNDTVKTSDTKKEYTKKESMKYRDEFEYPHPNKREIAHFIATAKTPEERKVWRDLLNSNAFRKARGRKSEKAN